MNYYILTEDSESLIKVLPNWLQYMGFTCVRVPDITFVDDNNYILQSGHGVIQLVTKALFETFDTIIDNDNKIDELIIILDAEETNPDDRYREVLNKIDEYEQKDKINFNVKIFICNCCFESWLLCNSSLYPSVSPDKSHPFFTFYNYYNIKDNDPEKMEKPSFKIKNTRDTKAGFHFAYFHEMCRYNKKRYSKHNVTFINNKDFFDGIVARIQTTQHGCSFRRLYDYISSIEK